MLCNSAAKTIIHFTLYMDAYYLESYEMMMITIIIIIIIITILRMISIVLSS